MTMRQLSNSAYLLRLGGIGRELESLEASWRFVCVTAVIARTVRSAPVSLDRSQVRKNAVTGSSCRS